MNPIFKRSMLALLLVAAPLSAQDDPKIITDDDVEDALIALQEKLKLIQQGSMKPDELKRAYERAAAKAPNAREKSIAYYVLGQGLAMVGNEKEARVAFEEALEFPGCLPSYVSLAKLAVRNNSLDEGNAIAQRALDIEPDYGQALLIVGTIARLRSDWDKALEYYKLAQTRDVSDDSCSLLATTYIQLWQQTFTKRLKDKYAEEALKAAKTWRALSPRSPFAYLKLEQIYAMLGRTDDGRKLLKKGLESEMSKRGKAMLVERWAQIELGERNLEGAKAALTEFLKYRDIMPPERRERIGSMLEDLEQKGVVAFVTWEIDVAMKILENKGRSQEERRAALQALSRVWQRIAVANEPRLYDTYREIRSTIVRTCVNGPAVLQLDMLKFFKHEMPDPRLIGVLVHFIYPWQRTVKVRTEAVRTIRSVMGIAGIPTLLFALEDDDGTVLRAIDRALSELTSRRSRVGEENTPLNEAQIKLVRQDWYRWRNSDAGAQSIQQSLKELRNFVRLDGEAKGAPLAQHVMRIAVSRDIPFPAWLEAYKFLRDYLGETFLDTKERDQEVDDNMRGKVIDRIEEFQRAAQGAGLD